jgi:hypothetical protein
MIGVDDTERKAVYRKNGDGTGVPWVILSIEVAAQGEQDSTQSARVTSFGKIVPPPAGSVAQVISEQYHPRKLVVLGQGAESSTEGSRGRE